MSGKIPCGPPFSRDPVDLVQPAPAAATVPPPVVLREISPLVRPARARVPLLLREAAPGAGRWAQAEELGDGSDALVAAGAGAGLPALRPRRERRRGGVEEVHHRRPGWRDVVAGVPLRLAGVQHDLVSGVANWSKSRFVVDFRNLLFGRDFDLSFSKGYSLMKNFNYEVYFTAKCDT